MSSDPLNIAIKRWEDAHAVLSAAMKGYLDSCTYLETIMGLGCGHQNSSGSIASRIESTLSSLHHNTTRQLAQITSSLTRTRNRLVSPIFHLPDDVLLEIFLRVVYPPANRVLFAEECIRTTYSGLHNLMVVCFDWRNLAYRQGVFWEIIPASDGWVKHQVTERIIQRAGNRGLRLAVIIPNKNSLPQLIKFIDKHISRFCALNIQSQNLKGIHALVKQLSRDGSRISDLSIRYNGNYHDTSPDKHESAFIIYPKSLDQAPFTRMVQSLSVLRLSNCLMQWATITFSDRLVEPFVCGIKLPNSGSAMASFLTAISTASELRDLKVIDLQACYNPAETAGLMARPKIVFPKLQTLILRDLWFNVLELFLHALAPGSHLSTLHVTPRAIWTIHLYGRLGNGVDSTERADFDRLITLLSHGQFSVDRLSLASQPGSSNWLKGPQVRRLLAILPSLKELEIVYWDLDSDFFSELSTGTTLTSSSGREGEKLALPKLELLELKRTRLRDEEGLKRFLSNIPIQKMDVRGTVIANNYAADGGIIEWLKCKVPSFQIDRTE